MGSAAHAIEVFTLGGLRVDVGGVEATALSPYRKPLALLAVLAVERVVPRERAVALLWSESPEEKARHSLSQTLLHLKRYLPGDWLDSARDAIGVSDDVWCDAPAFDAACAEGRLDDALALYAGPFLASFDARVAAFEQWAGRRTAHHAVRLRDAVRERIAGAVASGHVDQALAAARRWVEVAADEDEAQHRLIELLASTGRRSEALEHYELYRRALELDELTPLDETVALVEQIRRGESLGPLTTMLRGEAPRASGPRTRRFGSPTVEAPRLVRIADGGVEAESYYLHEGATRIGRTQGEIVFPFDAQLEDLHAVIDVVAGVDGGVPRMVLRDAGGSVYLRIRDSWPLRSGDRFRVGQQQFRFDLHSHGTPVDCDAPP